MEKALRGTGTVRSLTSPLVVTQKLSVSMLPNYESRPEFAQDHESGLRSDRDRI
jgi:hypothetical protein